MFSASCQFDIVTCEALVEPVVDRCQTCTVADPLLSNLQRMSLTDDDFYFYFSRSQIGNQSL